MKGRLSMFSRRFTVTVAGVVAAVALAGGAYGLANATSRTLPSTTTPAGQVIPFTPGQQGASQAVGQIPSSYTQGSGTIVTGAAADQATAAAAAAYPGGTINRVVLLSSGEYEVHMIAVSWPHHIFVNSSFQVIGAN
jgi:hypothetical protein